VNKNNKKPICRFNGRRRFQNMAFKRVQRV
jgi:hypothetical protein